MKADAAQLLNAEWSPTVEFVDFPWVPVIDNEFLNELPSTSLKTGNFKKNAELLAGSNRDEAIYFIVYQLTVSSILLLFYSIILAKVVHFLSNET